MSMTSTSQIQKKRPGFFVPENDIQDTGDLLECLKLPEYTDAHLKLQLPYVWYIVRTALRHPEQKGLVATNEEFQENVQLQGEGSFYDQLRDVARRRDWGSPLRNEAFCSQATPDVATSQSAPLSDAKCSITALCPRQQHCEFVRDKSRMVDELAKNIMIIPMCLRDEGTQGFFPPSDGILRVWLSSFKDPNYRKAVTIKLYSLVEALLVITCDRLAIIEMWSHHAADIPKLSNISLEHVHKLPGAEQDEHVAPVKRRREMLAQAFRRHMTEGQPFNVPKDDRHQEKPPALARDNTHPN
ncbi:hypothetical protein BJY52DRAFT_1227973 [Lactarius psammicola]|nr:hypothetical protein BJY52DRAFT_1227973 [Lactarius psammicola]